VPYTVNVVNPVTANVTVSGTAIQPGDAPAITSAVQAALVTYFTLPFGSAAQLNQIIAAVAGAVQGQTNSLSIQMTDSSANVQTTIAAGPTQRIIPGIITVSFS
jgi:tetrahydromethanopterin S-methyltransferase subunit C